MGAMEGEGGRVREGEGGRGWSKGSLKVPGGGEGTRGGREGGVMRGEGGGI